MSKHLFIVVPAPGHYGDRGRVRSSHATLVAAERACGPGECVRAGNDRTKKGSEWLRVYEQGNPVLFQKFPKKR